MDGVNVFKMVEFLNHFRNDVFDERNKTICGAME